jgi:hypothetical protein
MQQLHPSIVEIEFVSWEENLQGDATQLIKVSRPASTGILLLPFLVLNQMNLKQT